MSLKHGRVTILFTVLCIVSAVVAARPVSAQETTDSGSTICNCTAYIIDTDPKGLNVRSGPGTDYPVTATLPGETQTDVEVTIDGSAGPWMRIASAYIFAYGGMTDDVEKKINGFVYGPKLAVETRARGLSTVPLYAEPDKNSRVVAKLPDEIETPLTGCRDAWVKVKYGEIEGWLDPESHCGNPVTTCVKGMMRRLVAIYDE